MPISKPPYGSSGRPAAATVRPGSAGRISGRARVTPYDDADFPPAPRAGYGDLPPGPPGRGVGEAPRRRPRPRWGRIALVALAGLLVLVLLLGVGFWAYAQRLNSSLGRTETFSQLAADRPAPSATGASNILMVGTDSRDPDAPLDRAGKWRADTLILMHVPSSRDRAYLVSIPRDLYVPVPRSAGDACDSGRRAKINAAFAWGGLPLAVRTVECFTDVRIDHVMAIDFAGFQQVTDALGGVDLYVERDITSIHKPYRKFRKGMNHMNGAEALDWIRQRKQFPDGDFARMRHQQEFLRAVMDKAASGGTLTNPTKLAAFLNATTDAVTVDEEFSLTSAILDFRKLRGENLHFLTSPHLGSDMINGESVVVSDRQKALSMYQAITQDKMADWVAANPPRDGSRGN